MLARVDPNVAIAIGTGLATVAVIVSVIVYKGRSSLSVSLSKEQSAISEEISKEQAALSLKIHENQTLLSQRQLLIPL